MCATLQPYISRERRICTLRWLHLCLFERFNGSKKKHFTLFEVQPFCFSADSFKTHQIYIRKEGAGKCNLVQWANISTSKKWICFWNYFGCCWRFVNSRIFFLLRNIRVNLGHRIIRSESIVKHAFALWMYASCDRRYILKICPYNFYIYNINDNNKDENHKSVQSSS